LPYHKYFGPGTHVVANINNKIKPTTFLDAAAMIHDIEYIRGDQFKADNNMYMNLLRHSILNFPVANYIRAAFLFKDVIGYPTDTDFDLYSYLKNKVIEYNLLGEYSMMKFY
jgi:hypothetical protein